MRDLNIILYFYVEHHMSLIILKVFHHNCGHHTARRSRDRMVVGFTTTCTISACHH
jgi:hypothetical protein